MFASARIVRPVVLAILDVFSHTLLSLGLLISVFGATTPHASAEPAAPTLAEIPAELKSWVPWVVAQHPEWNCARIPGGASSGRADGAARVCSWIGSASFVVQDLRTEFSVRGELLKDDRIPLPFSSSLRPSNLKVLKDGVAIEAYVVEETPTGLAIRLASGAYTVTGELLYDTLPDSIPVPAVYGIVEIREQLSQRKEGFTRAYRDNDSIRIVSRVEGAGADSVEGRLWRMISDDNPLLISTRIELQVSGKPRTVELGKVLPVGAILIGSESSSQIAFSDASELSAQVFQGRHSIQLESVLAQPVAQIQLPDNTGDILPEEEIWNWYANAQLRTVEVENARTLNAAQVELPQGWTAQTVLGVTRGAIVALKELRRGQEFPPKNELTLNRTIWPKLRGSGLAVEDTFSGIINSGFRLNALPELSLGSASIAGAPVPVTIDPQTKALGVELRSQQLNLKAVSEIPTSQLFSAEISAAGWLGTFENISLSLAIPPSWKVIHFSNVTSQAGSWSSLWSIFDLFLLLVLTVFSVRIFGAKVGYLFLAFTVLGKGEFMMPVIFYGWTLFFAACSLPLTQKSFPALRVACAAGLGSSLVAFLMQGLIFSKLQLVQAIHPQLQAGTRYRTFTQELLALFSESPYLWPAIVYGIILAVLLLIWVSKGKYLIEKFGRLVVAGIAFFVLSSLAAAGIALLGDFSPQSRVLSTGQYAAQTLSADSDSVMEPQESYTSRGAAAPLPKTRASRRKVQAPSDKQRLLQSGPSLPAWQWRTAFASVAGPVSSDHRITVYMVPELVERLACVLRLALTLLLAFTLTGVIFRSFRESLTAIGGATSGGAVAGLLLLLLLPINSARADFPPADLLRQLEQRLEEGQCAGSVCTSIDSIKLEMNQGAFTLELRVRSIGAGAVIIPGPVSALIPEKVAIDGRESLSSRLAKGHLQVKVPDGAHSVTVTGHIEPSVSLAVTIPEKSLRFTYDLSGWEISAPLATGTVPDEVRFTRQSSDQPEKDSVESRKGVVPTRNVFHVIRTLVVDDRVSVQGEIHRIGDSSKAVSARIPLHAGENVSSSNWPVENGALAVTFAPGELSVTFQSLISSGRQFSLVATDDQALFERWYIRCKDYVQCQTTGIAPTHRAENGEAASLFLPFKGETVTVDSVLLESATGNFVTIDAVQHSNSWGETSLKGQIELAVRATRQAPLVLAFSDSLLEIESASINGIPDTRRFAPENVSLLLEPGSHKVLVQYARRFTPGTRESVPQVHLNYPAGNITTTIVPSPSRWILWLGGSSWGPAVVFWSKLLVALILLAGLKIWGGLAVSWFAMVVLAMGISFLPTMLQPIPVLWIIFLSSLKVRDFLDRFWGARQKQITVSLLAAASLVLLYKVIRVGLLQDPPSLITGNGSSATMLRWFNDYVSVADGSILPMPWVLSFPLPWWRVITLLLSVALVFLGLKWVRATVKLVKED